MALPRPEPGLVISYAYLWSDQARAGLREGRKDRPAVIVVATSDQDGDTVLYVTPITHADPDDPLAVPLIATVKRRLGLDDAPSWIVTHELNRFVWPGHDLRPVSRREPDRFAWGFLPVDVFQQLKSNLKAQARAGRMTSVSRD